jgi:poly-gamma-glutamate synthesis protein (capsule biosynthesis protein)
MISSRKTASRRSLDATLTRHDTQKLAEELALFSEDVFVVVFLHWGNEYETLHTKSQEDFAHFFIDSGVDLVVGAHPHVVQDVETYNGKRIYYSLGNFVFDQYWNEEVQTGLMVKVVLEGDSVTYEDITITSDHSQPYIAASN